MTTPRPDKGGVTLNKPKNSGPQPVGASGDKTYPAATAFTPGSDNERIERTGTVTNTSSRPSMFRVSTGRGGFREWPTSIGGHDLDIKKDAASNVVEGQQYKIHFERPRGSSAGTPYKFVRAVRIP